jgi:hypothetical protein
MKQLLSNLLGRFRLWQKLAALGAIAALLVAIPFYLFLSGQQALVNVTVHEQQGLKPAAKLLELVQALQKHRDLSSSVLGNQGGEGFGRRKQKTKVEETIAAFDEISKGKLESYQRRLGAACARGRQTHVECRTKLRSPYPSHQFDASGAANDFSRLRVKP